MKPANLFFQLVTCTIRVFVKELITMTNKDTTYNGWANYETWNVALWISNDEGLYQIAKEAGSYKSFTERLKDIYEAAKSLDDVAVAFQTPDGVAWNDSNLDIDALNEMLSDL